MRAAGLLVAALLLALPGIPAHAEAVVVTEDGAGQPIADLSQSTRLLSIGGSITEIVHELGEGGRLVARDSTSNFPDAVLDLPDIGYMRALSPEGVLSVDPDAILMLEGSGPAEALDVLRAVDIPIVTIPETHDLEGILTKVRIIGAALGVSDKAEALAERIRADIEAATARTTGQTPPRILFILSQQAGKLMVAGRDTAADGVIRMAGAENAITEYPGYKQLTDEALITAAPDFILTMETDTEGPAIMAELRAMPAVQATPAGKADRIIIMDGAYLLGFGPRMAAALRDLVAILHQPVSE